VARNPFIRRAGPLGLALTLYDVYRRLPPKQRRQLLEATRKHGPRLAARALRAGASARRRRP
jgi:hypothetical protein